METYAAWWENCLNRPVIPLWLANRDPGRPQPAAPILSQATCADLSIPAEAIIDRLDYELSRCTFWGDAYPMVKFDSFGPGLAAAFLGARLDNATGRVWFHPEKVMPVSELQLRYDPENPWLERIRAIYRAGSERWGDQVLMSLPDLGGTLDVLSTFRPGDKLLLDLVDEPETVVRLNWEIHELWHRFFNELSDLLHAIPARGWTDWSGTFCARPAYILQCDMSYMISPAMFEDFVKPELAASAYRLGQAVYHLDGIGQLAHLDSILKIKEIHAVQWVPGDGKPPHDQWPDVYRKIHNAGKAKLVYCGLEGMENIARELGTAKGLCHMPVFLEGGRQSEFSLWEKALTQEWPATS